MRKTIKFQNEMTKLTHDVHLAITLRSTKDYTTLVSPEDRFVHSVYAAQSVSTEYHPMIHYANFDISHKCAIKDRTLEQLYNRTLTKSEYKSIIRANRTYN